MFGTMRRAKESAAEPVARPAEDVAQETKAVKPAEFEAEISPMEDVEQDVASQKLEGETVDTATESCVEVSASESAAGSSAEVACVQPADEKLAQIAAAVAEAGLEKVSGGWISELGGAEFFVTVQKLREEIDRKEREKTERRAAEAKSKAATAEKE